MFNKDSLSLEEKIKLLSGKSGDDVAEKHGEKYFVMSDGPHGVKKHGVCYPNMCLTSCSWDAPLLYAMGESIGYDCNAEGVDVLLGPSVNIKRSPLCGRNFEYVSEDPYLAGTLGAAYVNGIQSTGASACVKHFCCYNQENNRFTQKVYVDEDVMMDVYVNVFRILLKKSSPDFLMTSYNNVNGEFVAQSDKLMQHVLRNLLQFKGIVISDWGGLDYRVKAIKAGLDIQMPGDKDTSWKEVMAAIDRGELTVQDLEESLDRVLTALEKSSKTKPQKQTDFSLLKKLATESIVLLKNEGNILPVSKQQSIVVIGGLAKKPCVQGGGCATVESEENSNPYARLCERMESDIPYAEGYRIDTLEREEGLEEEAVQIAKKGETVLYFAGLSSFTESEGYDRKTLKLPENQLALLEKLRALGKKIVVVLTNGSVVELQEVKEAATAILECWYAGDVYADACCDVLFGEANPSGRLSETFPLRFSDYFPTDYYVDEKDCVRYKEGEFVGYKYYLAKEKQVCYPFGYGLSYTEFAYEEVNLQSSLSPESQLAVEIALRNTGKRTGKEVVQVYLQHESDKTPTLAGFTKVELEPNERKVVRLDLDSERFTKYDVTLKNYTFRKGKYKVSVRKNAETVIWEGDWDIGNKFECTRYTKIGELIKVGNGPDLISKYLSKYIGKAALDDAQYHLRLKGREIDEDLFIRNVAYSFPLYIFTTLTAGLLSNEELDEIIEKINQELVFDV